MTTETKRVEPTGYTPGPWMYEVVTGKGNGFVCCRINAPGTHGAVGFAGTYANNDARSKAEAITNARLIAAAPELLAALIRLTAEVAANDHEITYATFDAARATITKATGKG